MFRIFALGIALISSAQTARADVVDASFSGFHLSIERTLDVAPDRVYAAFVDVHEWWDGEHSWFGNAANFRLELRAGGCFCEVSGEHSALHMTVSFVDPGKEVRMIGGLGPLQAMGLSGTMVFRFEPHGDDGTRIVHEYRVTGYSKDGLEGLAPVVDAVQTHQVTRLIARSKKSDDDQP